MKKKTLVCMGLISAFLLGLTANTIAEPALQDITAQINNGIKIFLNGQQFKAVDSASGKEFKPIMYQGRTYLPLRAVADAAQLPVQYDSDTDTIYLGTKNKGKVKLTDFPESYNSIARPISITDATLLKVSGISFSSGIFNQMGNDTTFGTYDIKRNFTKMTFTAGVINAPNTCTITISDYDKKTVLKEVTLGVDTGLVDVELDVKNVDKLRIDMVLKNWMNLQNYGKMRIMILDPMLE